MTAVIAVAGAGAVTRGETGVPEWTVRGAVHTNWFASGSPFAWAAVRGRGEGGTAGRRGCYGDAMVRPVAVVVSVVLFGCNGSNPQSETGTGTTGTGGDGDEYDEGCSSSPFGTHGLFEYVEASIVDPAEEDPAVWTAPRMTCELSTIVDFDIGADGAIYAVGTSFVYMHGCGDNCPWRYWLRRIEAGGEEAWVKVFEFQGFNPRAVRALPDGGVAIGGSARVGGGRAPWLAAFDAAGGLQWENIFADEGRINAIATGPDEVVVAVGSIAVDDATDLWAVQVTSEGGVAWSSTLGDERHESGVAVAVDAAGRSWMVGGHAMWPIDRTLEYYAEAESDWALHPSDLRLFRHFDQPLVALMDAQGALLWSDEPASINPTTLPPSGGVGLDLLPEGDAVVGVSWWWEPQIWVARYAASGARVWERLVTQSEDYPGSVEDIVCDALGRTHVLVDGVIVELDAAGEVVGTLKPYTYGDEIVLTPAGDLRVSDWHYRGSFYEEGWGTGP